MFEENLHLAIGHPCGIAFYGTIRASEAIAGLDLKFPAVERTKHTILLDVSRAQRSALVRAGVVRGKERAIQIE